MSDWKRPENVPYPQIYKEFEGKLLPDGTKRKYWIQDLTEEFFDEVLHGYLTGFMVDEPLCRFSKSVENPICIEDFSATWSHLLKERLSLICLTKDENGKTVICGYNCLYRGYKGEPALPLKSAEANRIINVLVYLNGQRNLFEELNISEYIGAMGLFVTHPFRGEGLGQVILNTRDELVKSLGIKVTSTVYTSCISQKQAERAGFVDFVTISYEDIRKANSELHFPGIEEHTKECKLMIKIFE